MALCVDVKNFFALSSPSLLIYRVHLSGIPPDFIEVAQTMRIPNSFSEVSFRNLAASIADIT